MVAQSNIKTASGKSQDVMDIQDILTANASKIGVTITTPIGNSKTGQSDGYLGGRTSNALEQLVLLAQIHGNVVEGDRNSGFDTRNKDLVGKYLKDTGVDEATVSKMMTALEAVTAGKPSLMAKHYSTGQVDVASLKVPEIKVADVAPVASPTEIKDGFNNASGVETTPAPEPKPAGKEVTVTRAEYLQLKSSIDNNDAVTDGDKLKVKGYEVAFAKYNEESDLGKAAAEFKTAESNWYNRSETRAALEETRDRIENDPVLQKQFEDLEKEPVEVVVNGEPCTYSKAELDERYGARFNDGWATAGDKVDVVALRAAVDAKLESINPDYKLAKDTERQLDGFSFRVEREFKDAKAVLIAEEAKVNDPEFQLAVFIPDVVPASPTAEQAPAVAASGSPAVQLGKLGG